MTEAHISARTLAVLADAERLRRLRVAHRADAELYADLVTVAAVSLAYRNDANVTDLGVSAHLPERSEVTTTEAARILGITAHGVREARRRGRLDGTRRGTQWFITTESIARYRAA